MALYSFIAEGKACPDSPWSTAELCDVLEVSRSGFYDWQRRPPSEREPSYRQQAREIEAIYVASDLAYGAPRVHRWMLRQGFKIGQDRVAKIMAEHGWVGQIGKARKMGTTVPDKQAAPAPALLPLS